MRREVPFVLAPSVRLSGKAKPALKYVADFVYNEPIPGSQGQNWRQVVEDCKGFRTDVYRIKRHLMAALLGIEVRES